VAHIGLASSAFTAMNRDDIDTSRYDRKGMLIASLCFVHCIAGPVLLSFAGLASLISVSEKLEPLFLLGSAAMGAIALVPAYRKKHGRMSCLAMFASGLLCLLVRHRIAWRATAIEPAAVAIGATLIAGAHALNLKFSSRCQCCEPASDANSTVDYECATDLGGDRE
jgi:hypothetical protein